MKKKLLGDISLKEKTADFKKLFKSFEHHSLAELNAKAKWDHVNRALLEWIQAQKEPCFLLSDVLAFIAEVDAKKILHPYTFNHFELWLNQFSGLSFEENYRVRGKIAGKSIDRSHYQILFPIGMGKVYEGTHFVTAHKSPDLDTTVASFWGWLDAFAARVGDGLHIWNLPGGPPQSQIEIDLIFRDCFGEALFSHLAKTTTALHLTSLDLMTQKRFLCKSVTESIASLDHERDQNAIVVTDPQGIYLGDWNSFDAEGVRQVILLLSSCLRWFENHLHLEIISLFAQPQLSFNEVQPAMQQLFNLILEQCEPATEFTLKQRNQVDTFLRQVLKMPLGIHCDFDELADALTRFAKIPFHRVEDLTQSLRKLFDSRGKLKENRSEIFTFLQKAIQGLHQSIFTIRERLEKLDIALQTKYEVFGSSPHFVTIRSELEEIQGKMGNLLSLTVLSSEGKHPLGVILASDVRKPLLGTVSLRDFCNREEMTIPPYLDVISVIDHHKSSLQTFSPPLAIIADAQSSNSLVARAAFEINDRLKRHKKGESGFLHPRREFLEYLHFLYGILDDTDLLSKVSAIDVECVAALLNRLKGKTVVSLDDLPLDASYLKKASARLLKTEDLYSLYSKVYAFREKEVEKNITLCAEGKPSNFFADTKEQNGCCRIGQTKIFAKNAAKLRKAETAIQRVWLEKAKKVHEQNKEIDLHLHMISTIVSADEVYRGVEDGYSHKDEMWIWASFEENGIERLKRFLNAFQNSPGLKNNPLEVEFLGANAKEWAQIFKESFLEISHKSSKEGLEMAVLRFKAGSLNSRKAMVSPFLPRL
ncbi:MAG: hypothetical protein HY069_01700 [Chlamydiia bacterium]|nr:hypothetical protein [Chlamydiia bacterium]